MTGSKIVKLGVVDNSQAAGRQPQQDIVDLLESIIEPAKTGHIQAIAVTFVDSRGLHAMSWKGRTEEALYGTTLYRAVGLLWHRLNQHELTKQEKVELEGVK